jgi:hypothetical protein
VGIPAPDVLALRALQATRRLHLPTYIAIRYLVDSVFGQAESSWIETTLPRKYPRRRVPRFHSVMRFKKLAEDGLPEYREFLVPSPSTALAEVLVLAHLSAAVQFAKSGCVYSYLWPRKPDVSSFSFEHYVNGYKTRNDDIACFLEKNPDHVVIVSDIEKFYPNIQKETVRSRFAAALQGSDVPTDIRETANHLLEHLFSLMPGDRGVPTGPELSHVIGDMALSKVDHIFSVRYPGAYFRYVDDIVLAVPKHEVAAAVDLLYTSAEAEGLTIHPDKSDLVPGQEWLTNGPHHTHKVTENSFEALLFRIKVYLRKNPDAKEALTASLGQEGYTIPVARLIVDSQDDSFGRRLKKFLTRRWKVAVNAFAADGHDIVEKAAEVRGEIHALLLSMLNGAVPVGPTLRKWHMQRLRYLTNRTFYLFPSTELEFLIAPLSKLPEFAETVALLHLLVHSDVYPILKMPGAALTAGCGVLRQAGKRLPKIEHLDGVTPAIIESLAIILTFDVCDVSTELIASLEPDSRDFLLFCIGKSQSQRARGNFTYVDEIRSLQMSQTHDDKFTKIESRFSDQEAVVLDALDIGGDYAY